MTDCSLFGVSKPPSINRENWSKLNCSADTGQAVKEIIKKNQPKVLAIGELHDRNPSEAVRSATYKFNEEIMPAVRSDFTILVYENKTIANDEKCSPDVAKMVNGIRSTFPQTHTKNDKEIDRSLSVANSLGLNVVNNTVTCQELVDQYGEKDEIKRIKKIAESNKVHLQDLIDNALSASSSARVLSFGGAMHNDLFPSQDLRGLNIDATFGPYFEKKMGTKYVEVDLLRADQAGNYYDSETGEKIEKSWKRLIPPNGVLTIPRSANSYLILYDK
jgi:hypothetical protein